MAYMEELDIDETKDLKKWEASQRSLAELEAELLGRDERLRRELAAVEKAIKNLGALKISLALADGDHGTPNPDLVFCDEVSITPNGAVTYGEIRKALRETIHRQNSRSFSSSEILNYLRAWYPHINVDSNRSNISGYFRDFVEEGLLKIENAASGQRPTIYRKK
jgi:hypothetical protein